jgi:hypothetical protein
MQEANIVGAPPIPLPQSFFAVALRCRQELDEAVAQSRKTIAEGRATLAATRPDGAIPDHHDRVRAML